MTRLDTTRLPEAEPDGLPVMDVPPHAEEKYRLVWTYDEIFTKGMRYQWDELVYLDLFAGPGHTRIGGRRVVYGSPFLAMTVTYPFTRYVFCEKDPVYFEALEERVRRHLLGPAVSCIRDDANEAIEAILDLLPDPSRRRKMLTFCFVDPHKSGDFRFDSIRQLAASRFTDFLVLIPTGMDFKRGMIYYEHEKSEQLERWMGDPGWREKWAAAKARGEKLNYFMVRRFAEQMHDLGYILMDPRDTHPVYHAEKNFPLYHLAFFSKHPTGVDFWKKTLPSGSDQGELDLT